MPAASTTGLAVEVSIRSPNTPYSIAVAGTGNTRTVTIQVDHAGFWLFRLWVVDDSTDPREPTLTPPSGDATTQWFEVTDSTGKLEKTITHEGAGTWALAAALLAIVSASDDMIFT